MCSTSGAGTPTRLDVGTLKIPKDLSIDTITMRVSLTSLYPRVFVKIISSLILLAAVLYPAFTAAAQEATPTVESQPVLIYMFWGDTCPVCARAKPFLEGLAEKYSGVELRFYEIYSNVPNRAIFEKMAAKYGFEPRAVPTIFIGDYNVTGYNDEIAVQIEQVVQGCLAKGCPDAGAGVVEAPPDTQPTPKPTETPNDPLKTRTIKLPLIGAINLENQSLFVATLLISFVDGFNPCSLWVLSMLLALTIHTGSRKKVVWIGLIFLTVTALIYTLFIAGLFSVLKIISFVGWIQWLVALVAAFFALVNIKDYFFYKEGLSFTISDEKRPGIVRRLRAVMDASQSFWGLTGATIVLAAGVSLVEFSCTAGFPVLWTNLLTAQNVTAAAFVLLLLVYMLIYQIDELAIFFGAVATLRASRLQEKQGRILKLIGGVLMLTLAVVMIVNPEAMNNLSTSLVIFAIAFAVAALVLLVHRSILPRYGIWIGSEARPSTYKAKRGKRMQGSRRDRRHRHGN